MADNVSYGIGQYRFHNSAACIEEVGFSGDGPQYVSPPGSSSAMNSAYSDVCVKLEDGRFGSGKDYHLELAIPREIGFSHTVNVWLGNSSSPNGKIQPIRQIIIPPAAITGDKVHYVAIYSDSQSSEAQGPIEIKPSWLVRENGIVTGIRLSDDESSRIYRYFNYGILNESWRGGNTLDDTVATFEMVFRPLVDEFDCIYLTLERTSDDYRVISTDDDGMTRIGHIISIDPDKGFKIALHEMKQLNNGVIPHRALSRIGVWSRPGLMMAINGEEIRVGQSGYYELDAIPVTSISVFAQDFANDNFSIDYQYIDSQS